MHGLAGFLAFCVLASQVSGGEELVGEAGLVGEEGGGLFGNGLGGFFEVVGDFEDGGGVGGEGGEEGGPVDCAGFGYAFGLSCGPEVFVAGAVVVVEVELATRGLRSSKAVSLRWAGRGDWRGGRGRGRG